MNMQLYASGSYKIIDNVTVCGIGIVLISYDSYNRENKMELSFIVNDSDEKLIDLNAIKTSLLSVQKKYRHSKITIYTSNSSAIMSLTSNDKENDICKLFNEFTNISVELIAGDNINYNRSKELADNVIIMNVNNKHK